MWMSQQTVGITIMPKNFRSYKLAGANIGLEAGIVKNQMVTLSLYGLYEFFLGQDWNDVKVTCQGYSVGAKVYLKKIAFPAMAFGLSHNITKEKMQFTVSFGMSY